jgi:hypothetical protein
VSKRGRAARSRSTAAFVLCVCVCLLNCAAAVEYYARDHQNIHCVANKIGHDANRALSSLFYISPAISVTCFGKWLAGMPSRDKVADRNIK